MFVKKGIPTLDSLGKYPLIRFVSCNDLVYLTRDEGLFSQDRHGNTEIIKQVVLGLGKSSREKFSCAAICHNNSAYRTLKLLGNGEALLLIKKEMVAAHAFLFNGDFQNLSNYARGIDGIQKTFSHCQLTDNYANFIESHPAPQASHAICLRKDRLNGNYFECRIFRPLCLDDIEDIYVSDTEGALQESLTDYIQRRSASLEKLWE